LKIACHRCSRPTDNGDGVCDECASVLRPEARVYDQATWRRTSMSFLRRNPWCALCEERGMQVKATVADHWPMSRKELIAAGIDDPDQHRFLRPLCKADHNARAASHTIRFDNDPA
jgi:hypothetical protein